MHNLQHFDFFPENCYVAVNLPGKSRGADMRSLHFENFDVPEWTT